MKHKVTITLTIETKASGSDLEDALDSLLDGGQPQDELTEALVDVLDEECRITNAEASVFS